MNLHYLQYSVTYLMKNTNSCHLKKLGRVFGRKQGKESVSIKHNQSKLMCLKVGDSSAKLSIQTHCSFKWVLA